VEYSTNARGYTLQALCYVVLLALTVFAARRQSRSALLLAALVAALATYAVPTMLYGVAVAALWLIVELRAALRSVAPAPGKDPGSGIRIGHLVAAGFVIGLATTLLYLPVVLVSGPDKLAANRFVVPLGGSQLLGELARSIAQTWAFWNRDIPLALAGLLVIGFVLGSRRVPLGLVAAVLCVVLVLV